MSDLAVQGDPLADWDPGTTIAIRRNATLTR